jgi:hypothetical protein
MATRERGANSERDGLLIAWDRSIGATRVALLAAGDRGSDLISAQGVPAVGGMLPVIPVSIRQLSGITGRAASCDMPFAAQAHRRPAAVMPPRPKQPCASKGATTSFTAPVYYKFDVRLA